MLFFLSSGVCDFCRFKQIAPFNTRYARGLLSFLPGSGEAPGLRGAPRHLPRGLGVRGSSVLGPPAVLGTQCWSLP